VQGLSHRSMEYVAGRPVPHHRAEPSVSSPSQPSSSMAVPHSLILKSLPHHRAEPSVSSPSQPSSSMAVPHSLILKSLRPAPPRHHGGMARRRHDSSSHHHERTDNDGDDLLRLNGNGSCTGWSAMTSFGSTTTVRRKA
jgi:hypothetical protein